MNITNSHDQVWVPRHPMLAKVVLADAICVLMSSEEEQQPNEKIKFTYSNNPTNSDDEADEGQHKPWREKRKMDINN